jgi:hypothetical protein
MCLLEIAVGQCKYSSSLVMNEGRKKKHNFEELQEAR